MSLTDLDKDIQVVVKFNVSDKEIASSRDENNGGEETHCDNGRGGDQ